jgi:hypothetical protein
VTHLLRVDHISLVEFFQGLSGVINVKRLAPLWQKGVDNDHFFPILHVLAGSGLSVSAECKTQYNLKAVNFKASL